MSRQEVKDKLVEKLKLVPQSEEDVVYILSRVRKILERKNHPDKYSILNFYCNLSLHTKITKAPKIIVDELKKFREGSEKTIMFDGSFVDFHGQLKNLLNEEGIQNFYPLEEQVQKEFNGLLIDIWSHTPIRIEYVEAYDVMIEGKHDELGIVISIGTTK